MESLLEALGALGRLGQALDTMVQRVPSEIHTLIETTMEEVEDRADQRAEEMSALAAVRPQQFLLAERHDLESMPLFDNDTLRVVLSLDGGGPPKHAIILHDLFWTLFSKLSAVMEGHRAVYEVSRWIASRRDFKDVKKSDLNVNVPILEVWRPVQHEVRSLLRVYLRDESQGSSLLNSSIPSINEILREGRFARDKQKVSLRRPVLANSF
jgi:exocyst complex component 4